MKRGHDLIVITIIILTVILVGVVLLLKSSSITGESIQDIITPVDITDFNAVYNSDGTVSMTIALKSYENIEQGLTGKLKIIISSYSKNAEYNANFFFDGAFAKLKDMAGEDNGRFTIANPEGVLVITNSINNQATMLSRISFISPEFKGGPNPPENIAVTIEYITYDKIYQGGVIIPFVEQHTSGKYYTASDGKIEINY